MLIPTTIIQSASGATPVAYGCLAFNSAAISVGNGAGQKLTFDSELFDSNSFHSTVTNTGRLTVPAGGAGVYLVTAQIDWASSTSGIRAMNILLNNGNNIANLGNIYNTTGGTAPMGLVAIYKFADADFIELAVFQNSGGALNVAGTANQSPYFGMVRIGT